MNMRLTHRNTSYTKLRSGTRYFRPNLSKNAYTRTVEQKEKQK